MDALRYAPRIVLYVIISFDVKKTALPHHMQIKLTIKTLIQKTNDTYSAAWFEVIPHPRNTRSVEVVQRMC